MTAEMLTRCGIGKVKTSLFVYHLGNPITSGVNQVQIRIFFLLTNGLLICAVFIYLFSIPGFFFFLTFIGV